MHFFNDAVVIALARQRAIAEIILVSGATAADVLVAVAKEDSRRQGTEECFSAAEFVSNVLSELGRGEGS